MMEAVRLLTGTIQLRPYVFIFFGCYLFLAIARIGWRRSTLYTVLAYLIAFGCEYSSIHYGFPFGLYHYIERTRGRELWIAGIPFMDSLSFVFLSYVSWEMANLLRLPTLIYDHKAQRSQADRLDKSWVTAALAGTLMMYLDVIIDPLTLQGSKWFLGQIYYYPNGGAYFGVPVSNFLGWWFVGFVVVKAYGFVERCLFAGQAGEQEMARPWYQSLGAPIVYFGVLAFNLVITFWIGEILMGIFGTLITLLLFLPLILALTGKESCRAPHDGLVRRGHL